MQSEDWKKDLEKNAWSEDFMGHAETRRHLDSEHQLITRMLSELGVLTK